MLDMECAVKVLAAMDAAGSNPDGLLSHRFSDGIQSFYAARRELRDTIGVTQ